MAGSEVADREEDEEAGEKAAEEAFARLGLSRRRRELEKEEVAPAPAPLPASAKPNPLLVGPQPSTPPPEKSKVEQLKDMGNEAFKKAKILQRTTAAKQYLNDARCSYVEAIQLCGQEPANDATLALVCTLHANLSLVHLSEFPPRYELAKAAAEIALQVNSKNVKALYRRAQALLEDEREGLPEAQLREALGNLRSVLEEEPGNRQAAKEAERIQRRLHALEEARRVPEPAEIAGRIALQLMERGCNLLKAHGYVWGQTKEVIHLFVPARGVRIGKGDLEVEIRPNSLRIVLPTVEGLEPFELKGSLHKPIRPDESSWQLEDKGLLLHMELAKRDRGEHEEHFERIWAKHLDCKVPSLEELKALEQLKEATRLQDEKVQQPPNAKAEETVRRIREMCPGINVEWGETDPSAYR